MSGAAHSGDAPLPAETPEARSASRPVSHHPNASLTHLDAPPATRGMIDSFDGFVVKGWALTAADPMKPVALELWIAGVPVARFATEQERADIAQIVGLPTRAGILFDLEAVPRIEAQRASAALQQLAAEAVELHEILSVRIAGTSLQLPLSRRARATQVEIARLVGHLAVERRDLPPDARDTARDGAAEAPAAAREPLGRRLALESSARGVRGVLRPAETVLAGQPRAGLRLDLAAAVQGGCLALEPSEARAPLLLDLIFRAAAEVVVEASLGADRIALPAADAEGWCRLSAYWPAGEGKAEFALELPGGGQVELAVLRLTPLSPDIPGLPTGPSLRWAEAGAAAQPDLSVLALGGGSNGARRFLIVGPAGDGKGADGKGADGKSEVVARTEEGAARCFSELRVLGPDLRYLEVVAARPGAEIELLGVTPDGAPLHLEVVPGLDGAVLSAEATYLAGVLRAEMRFAADAVPPGTTVELQAGGLGLYRAVLEADPLAPNASRAAMEVRASRRTAELGLAIVLPTLGFSTPCRLLAADEMPTKTALLPPAEIDADGEVAGSVDGLRIDPAGRRFVTGWARGSGAGGAPVTIDLAVDGVPVAAAPADRNRPDVVARLGGSPHCGFQIEVPSNFLAGRDVAVVAAPRSVADTSGMRDRTCRLPPYGTRLETRPRGPRLLVPPPAAGAPAASVAAIILNQDGAALLDAMLESVARHDANGFRRILVIDHGSEDDSEAVVARHAAGLPVTFVKRPRDASFSESNNHGATLCDEAVLLFINNDIVLTEPLAEAMARALEPGVGLVGIRLMDPVVADRTVTHQAQQHVGVHFEPLGGGVIQPIESRYLTDVPGSDTDRIATPATTAACVAMRRDLFATLGGFGEEYYYGWEDTDLCLKVRAADLSVLTLNDLSAVHVRGASRRLMTQRQIARRRQNEPVFRDRWTYALRRVMAQAGPDEHGYWTGRRMAIGFVVSEVGENAVAGDYMTALELALAFSERGPIQCFFYAKTQAVDALGLDALIVMTDDFDVRKVANRSTTCLLIAWARNWFHRWAAQPWRELFGHWFASSERACEYLRTELGRDVGLLRIATNPARFSPGPATAAFRCSVSFTGNNWNSPRDINTLLPRVRDLDLRLFGNGWDRDEGTRPMDGGFQPYHRLPQVYRSSDLVIDDSNFATVAWGSLNSRVFDALATGTLVVTNNAVGVAEAFPGLLPTYRDAASLEATIREVLADPERHRALAERARAEVLRHHTYAVRAQEMFAYIARRAEAGLRIAIKIAAPSLERVEGWGDWYFARSLRRELEALGHTVRIDCLDMWNDAHTHGDDAVLVIRGLSRYRPRKGQINLLWIISHPDMISAEELGEYDHVFAASEVFVRHFDRIVKKPVEFLPQCTDPQIFRPEEGPTPGQELVFVGNSRRVRRPVVAGAVASGLPLRIYGLDWKGVVPDANLMDGTVRNEMVGDLYRGAGIVLNDHWDDMRRWGFVSNRLFDAVACGVPVVSDAIEGLDTLTSGIVRTFASEEELPGLLADTLSTPPDAAALRRAAEAVIADHSFARRAARFDEILRGEDAVRARFKPVRAA
ncbi:glycosyltransferase [Methylorubrum sp. SB2]|uniref:glycosyltransferase family protein n=1 Tax=Methylorubrum subtropicum TaxID=3138812 RepID=UPI00313DB35B